MRRVAYSFIAWIFIAAIVVATRVFYLVMSRQEKLDRLPAFQHEQMKRWRNYPRC